MERGNLYPEMLVTKRASAIWCCMKIFMIKNERGVSLIEAIIALALIGIFGVTFLGALGTSSKARLIADEQTSARILAESQMEYVREQPYYLSYDPAPIPEDYASYTAVIDVDSMRNGNIQKITVSILRRGKEATSLQSYKVNR